MFTLNIKKKNRKDENQISGEAYNQFGTEVCAGSQMSKVKRQSAAEADRVGKPDQNIQEGREEGAKILDANSVGFFFFYSLVCLHERQRSEMEKCHLASIRLLLSSPCRSERWGEGLFKRVLKGCEPPFDFEIIPSLIFISAEHVKHVSVL